MRNPLLAGLKGLQNLLGGSGLGRVKPIRWAYDQAFGLLKPRSVLVQGHRMWLDDKDTLELATREVYEPLETALLKKELKEGQTFLDLGANIGYYTLLAARQVGPNGRVFAFEPDTTNFSLLKKNIAQNGYPNARLVPKAVSNRRGSTRLFRSETNRGDHRLYDSKDGRKSIQIRTLTLDGYFLKMDKTVHFIKMDIQGSEPAALAGMKTLVRANRRLKLVSEFWPGGMMRFGWEAKAYLLALQKLGFQLQEISEKSRTLKPVRPKALLSRYTVENDNYTNLYCVKG